MRIKRKTQAGKRKNTNTAIISSIIVNILKCLASRELLVLTLQVLEVDPLVVAGKVNLPPKVLATLLGTVVLEL